MTILNLGNTPVDFGLPASVVSTLATGRDAAYSPSSLLCLASEHPVVNIPADAGTDYWFHWRFLWNNIGSAAAVAGLFGFRVLDAASALICDMSRASTTYVHTLRVFGSATVSGATFTFVNNTTYTMDLKVTVGASGANIVVELYINGALHTSVTAVNTGTVKTKPRRAILEFSSGLAAAATGINYTEIIAAVDESTIGARLATLEPTSAGAFATMAGTVASLADADTATGVTATAAAQRFNSVFSAYGGAASPTVRGVFLKSQVSQSGAAAPTQLNQSIRISATNYDGAAQVIVPGVGNIHEWANNPNTAAPWLTAALAAFEGGLLSAT